jgi:hypothetical protein
LAFTFVNSLFQRGRFYCAQLLRYDRVVLLAALFSLLCCIVAAAGWLRASMAKQDEWQSLDAMKRQHSALPVAQLVAEVDHVPSDLQRFNSAEFVARFQAAATSVGLPLDEVAYAVDVTNAQPYFRYKATANVKTSYPAIRKFVAALAADMPNTRLDAIRCSRENPSSAVLGCELVFSAFFLKN